MHVARGAGHVVRDATASGRRALLLEGGGTARASVRVRASSRLTVVVRARACAGAPRLVVAVDGARVLTRRRHRARLERGRAGVVDRRRSAADHAAPGQSPSRASCRRGVRVDRLISRRCPRRRPRPAGSRRRTRRGSGSSRRRSTSRSTPSSSTSTCSTTPRASSLRCTRAGATWPATSRRHARARRPDAATSRPRSWARSSPAGPASTGSTSAASTSSARSWSAGSTSAAQKGFDGVEPDNVDAYTNDSGFPLTAADQLAYNGSSPPPRTPAGCRSGSRTTSTRPPSCSPTSTGRSTSSASSTTSATACSRSSRGQGRLRRRVQTRHARFCPEARAAGLMAMRKRLSLDAWSETCW